MSLADKTDKQIRRLIQRAYRGGIKAAHRAARAADERFQRRVLALEERWRKEGKDAETRKS